MPQIENVYPGGVTSVGLLSDTTLTLNDRFITAYTINATADAIFQTRLFFQVLILWSEKA